MLTVNNQFNVKMKQNKIKSVVGCSVHAYFLIEGLV